MDSAHSRFHIPIEIDELSICEVKRGTKLADLFIATDLIIWDEAIMTNRQCFEALDRSFKDILSQKDNQLEAILWRKSSCPRRRSKANITSNRKCFKGTNYKCINISIIHMEVCYKDIFA